MISFKMLIFHNHSFVLLVSRYPKNHHLEVHQEQINRWRSINSLQSKSRMTLRLWREIKPLKSCTWVSTSWLTTLWLCWNSSRRPTKSWRESFSLRTLYRRKRWRITPKSSKTSIVWRSMCNTRSEHSIFIPSSRVSEKGTRESRVTDCFYHHCLINSLSMLTMWTTN